MFDKIKNAAQGVFSKPDLTELVFQAKTELAKAKRDNESVIRIEKNQLKHYEEQKQLGRSGFEEAENNAKLKLKKAYYALYAIRETEFKLADVYSTQLFYSAMNKYNAALKFINSIRTTEKPKIRRTNRNMEKVFGEGFGPSIKDERRLDDMYENNVVSMDDIVDDQIIDDLINGKNVNDCLGNYVGVKCTYDDLGHLDGFPSIDAVNADFSDLHDN